MDIEDGQCEEMNNQTCDDLVERVRAWVKSVRKDRSVWVRGADLGRLKLRARTEHTDGRVLAFDVSETLADEEI